MIQELPARAERIIKAAMNAGNLSDPEWVANVTDANLASHAFIESLTSTSAFVSMLTGNNIWRVPLRTPISVNATAATGYVVGEGMGKPLSRLSMTCLTIPLLKAICMCVISDEVAKQSILRVAGLRLSTIATGSSRSIGRYLPSAHCRYLYPDHKFERYDCRCCGWRSQEPSQHGSEHRQPEALLRCLG